jgi:hypothetical protein
MEKEGKEMSVSVARGLGSYIKRFVSLIRLRVELSFGETREVLSGMSFRWRTENDKMSDSTERSTKGTTVYLMIHNWCTDCKRRSALLFFLSVLMSV